MTTLSPPEGHRMSDGEPVFIVPGLSRLRSKNTPDAGEDAPQRYVPSRMPSPDAARALLIALVLPMGLCADAFAQSPPPELRRDPTTNEWVLEPELVALVEQDPELGAAIRAGLDYVATGFDSGPFWRPGFRRGSERGPAAERRERIRKEIEALGPHDWAGVYDGGGGFTGHILEIAPEAGAAYSYWACMAEGFNHGDASFVDGRFTLDLALQPSLLGHETDHALRRPYVSNEWYLVRWSDERYLLPSSQMIPFCNALPDGWSLVGFSRFPRRRGSVFLFRDADDLPEGLPEVPAPYDRFVLTDAVECTVVEADEPERFKNRRWRGPPKRRLCVVRTRVNAGAKQGLLPGMTLRVIEPAIRSQGGEVVYVGASSAVVDFRIYFREDTDLRIPAPRWTLRAGPQ